jgi:prepilin-type N-terminal cleavage/methylation domain-containing protein
MNSQRGFSLVETLVVASLVAAIVLFATSSRGARAPQVHAAAIGFGAALVEARTLAASNASANHSGATLTVAPAGNGTIVAVYRSRPVAGWPPLEADTGFPALRFPVTIALSGDVRAPRPFAILVSSSGYASIERDYTYDPARPSVIRTDPGCDESAALTVTVSDGVRSETHPLDCREAQYETSASS